MEEQIGSKQLSRRSALKMAGLSGVLGFGAGVGITAGAGSLMGTVGDESNEADADNGPPEGIEVPDELNWQWESEVCVSNPADSPIIIFNDSYFHAEIRYFLGDTRFERIRHDGNAMSESKVIWHTSEKEIGKFEFEHPRSGDWYDIDWVTDIEIHWREETITVDLIEASNHAIWLGTFWRVWTGQVEKYC